MVISSLNKSRLYSDFLNFLLMPFPVLGSHTGYHIMFSSHSALDSSRLQASQTCFFWPWLFWTALVMHFVECPLIEIYLMFFSWSDWGNMFLGGKPQRESVILMVSCQGNSPPTWLILDDAKTSIAWLRGCQVSPLQRSCRSWTRLFRPVLLEAPHMEGVESCAPPTSLRAEHLHILSGILQGRQVSRPYLFIFWIIYLH